MKALEEKILKEGAVLPGGVLKVDGFLNHRIDVAFLNEIGREFARIFAKDEIDKIVTVEASGIGVACIAAQHFGNCPVVFAKKSKTSNISNDYYTAKVHSFTHGNVADIIVSREYLTPGERVLIIDDFLAKGSALEALLTVCREAKVKVVGCGIVVEKVFQGGGNNIRERGIRVESLARIESMSEDSVKFM
jgi:xanthine phosphoribosyltransferase